MTVIATTPPVDVQESLTAGDVANAASDAADRAVSLLEALPGEAHITMAVALVAGLVLWLYGARLLRPMFVVLGLALGGLIGLVVPPSIGITAVGGVAGWLIGLGAGSVIGLVVALVLLKIAITFSAGLALAVAGFLGGLVYLQYADLPPIEGEPAGEEVAAAEPEEGRADRTYVNPLTGERVPFRGLLPQSVPSPADDAEQGGGGDSPGEAPETEADGRTPSERVLLVAARVRAVLSEAADFAGEQWSRLNARERLLLLGSTTSAFAVGLLLGLALPKRSSALVTALFGSAVWLSSAVWLIQGIGPLSRVRPLVEERSPTTWAIVWGVIALIGLAAQVGGLAKRGKPRTDENE